MTDLTFAFGGAIFVVALLTIFSRSKISGWEERGFVNLLLPWSSTFAVAGVANLLIVLGTIAIGGTWWQAVLLGLIAWMLVFTCVTDFATYKIPSETSILAYLLPLALAIPLTWGDKTAYISAGLWFGAIFLLDIMGMVMKGGIGGGDIRLFLLVGSGLSWWVGIDWMFYAFGVSALLQLLVFFVARLTGWGRIKPAGSLNALSKEDSKIFKATQRAAILEGTEVPKGRKVTPFGPAILVTFLIMGLMAAAAGHTACSAYDGLICF